MSDSISFWNDDLLPWEDTPIDTSNSAEIRELADHQDLPSPEVTTPTTTPTPETNTGELWKAMQDLHNMGLSMIWGRAEPQSIKGKVYDAKTPLVSSWSSEPERRLSLEALAKMMHNAPSGLKIAPIIICGKGSGNLWAIDIDIKHWPGIDVRYFAAIRETFPDLWARLRIHKTPSGGFHLIYRIEIFVEGGNKKLAYKEDVKDAGIETRAHGGYIMAPPGMGYEVYRDVPIPVLSVEDHSRLIMLAQLFNEKIKPKTVRTTKRYEEIYDENPFQHFNHSPAAEEVLLNHGWELFRDTSQWLHFTRPGKDSGISASFSKENRFYHFFTTSTGFEGDKTYDAAATRAFLECNDDYKKLYPILVSEGYGKHKANYEAKVIKKATETGKPLPKNFSEEAKQQLQVAITEKNTKYPHGIYWEFNPNSESYIIQRELLDRFLNNLGLRVYHGEPCVIEGQFVRKLKENKKKPGESEVYKLIKSWIREEEEDTYLCIAHEFSKFWQASRDFIISILEPLDEKLILKSNPKTCYKFFADKILEISGEGKVAVEYESKSEYLIWADERIDRNWNYVEKEAQAKTIFVDFIRKAISGDHSYVNRVLGYLCNGYKVSSESYLTALMEPSDASKGGGTGKNFTFDMLGYYITVLTTNGQAVKKDVDQLIQNWNGEKLVHLSDLPKWVNLSDLKHIVSDNSQRKLLYKDIQNIPKELMPKFVLSGQFGLNTEDDGGVRRRIRMLSFSGYFHGDGAIRREYGGDIPDIFTEADWDGYFSFLSDCVQEYMAERKLEMVENHGLWLKGWDMRYSGGESYLREAIEAKVATWAKVDYVTSEQLWEWYEAVCKANGVNAQDKIKGIQRLHNANKEYGTKMDLFEYHLGDRESLNGIQQRVVKVKLLNQEEIDDPLPL